MLGGGAQAANDAIRAPITGKAAAAGTFFPLPAMLSHSALAFVVCRLLFDSSATYKHALWHWNAALFIVEHR
jgi:hypothetical protein